MNTKTMNAFERYLSSVRRRERFRLLVNGALVALLVSLIVIGIATALGLQRGFTDTLVWSARAVALVGVLVGLFLVLVKPWRRLSDNRGTELVEEADTAFDGRAETWLHTAKKTPDHPFLAPLADDAMRIAQRVPKNKVIKPNTIGWPILALMVLFGVGYGFIYSANQTIRVMHRSSTLGWLNI